MKKIFTKVKDYITATACRKVFFFGIIFTLVMLTLYLTTGYLDVFLWATLAGALVTVGASMVDSMQMRITFIRRVKAMQYDHVQTLYAKQQAGEAVTMTSAFSHEERKYIRRKKWEFVLAIILKLAFCLVFLSVMAGLMM